MIGASRRSQAGITAIGFLVLASLVGVVGLAAVKVMPMYIKKMRMDTILNDVSQALRGQSPTPTSIRYELAKRFSIEDIKLNPEQFKIAQTKSGYSLRVQYEDRAPYVAEIYLVMAYDKQVEIAR